jgi:lipopolysaccharide transport system permease protein
VLEPTITNQPALTLQAEIPDHTRRSLPKEPLVTIEPTRAWGTLNLRDLWAYRELLFFLAWRDLKVRYKQTALGVAWVIMQPLMFTLIFTLFLGMLARVPTEGVPYPLLFYVGLLPWTFFSSALSSSGLSLVSNAHLITKVYFPRLIVPTAAVAARLVDFAIAFVILVGLMIYYRVALTWNALMLPVLILLVTFLTLALGILTSALNVKYRDVSVVLPVLLQLWFYVSPVIYPLSLVPTRWRAVYSLNPLVGIVDGFRSAILGRPFNWTALAITATMTVLLLAYAVHLFRRVEKSFADVV